MSTPTLTVEATAIIWNVILTKEIYARCISLFFFKQKRAECDSMVYFQLPYIQECITKALRGKLENYI